MNWIDAVIVIVVALILGLAGLYIYRSKRKGKKCVACPCSGNCGAEYCRTCYSDQKSL